MQTRVHPKADRASQLSRTGANKAGDRTGGRLGAAPLSAASVLQFQRTAGNAAVVSLLNRPVEVQRLVDAGSFEKASKLTGRKGRSGEDFARWTASLRQYEGMGEAPVTEQARFLEGLRSDILGWLDSRNGKRSSRRKAAFALLTEVRSELFRVRNKVKPLSDSDFNDAHLLRQEQGKYGGQLSKLDEVEYGFGVEGESKVEGKTTTGLFKPGMSEFEDTFDRTRAPGAGMEKNDPRIVERNLAMYAVDKLLAADIIAPTWKAKHHRDGAELEGIVMEKVEGKSGDKLGKDDPIRQDPDFRRGLSNLYLLDLICNQVDRHPGNYIVQMKDGKVVGVRGIDNDLSFGPKLPEIQMPGVGKGAMMRRFMRAGLFADELTEIDHDFAQRIIGLSEEPDLLRNALRPLLRDNEIEAAVGRLLTLADFLRPLMNKDDGPVKTSWS